MAPEPSKAPTVATKKHRAQKTKETTKASGSQEVVGDESNLAITEEKELEEMTTRCPIRRGLHHWQS